MHYIQKFGLFLFLTGLAFFTTCLFLNEYRVPEDLTLATTYHSAAIESALEEAGVSSRTYRSTPAYVRSVKQAIKTAQVSLNQQAETSGIPDGASEWEYKIGDWKIKDYKQQLVRASAGGPVVENRGLWFFLSFGLGILGGLMYILPGFRALPGIKNDRIYHHSLTRGVPKAYRLILIAVLIIGVLAYGTQYMGGNYFWPVASSLLVILIAWLVMNYESSKENKPPRSADPAGLPAWFGIAAAVYFIGFYILLYWAPEYITNWIVIVDPISRFISGNPASRWFLYGFMYTVIMIIMGIKMLAKYRHNMYQIVRTISVVFFQAAFAFLIPELLVRLNKPWYDFKNIWPLNYSFFFDYNLEEKLSSGTLGIFMIGWGIALIVIAVPLLTYFFGKRWYCSWVCGCGGLAETMGDPYRHLSDKSLRAWKYERWIIHGVLLAAVLMTALVLYTFFTDKTQVLYMNTNSVRTWYGFLIGSAFAGVVGTGFYPVMGNRVWCRFGCPLAAYLGLVQRFKSRFRITVNGGQCISCGNCSTYCEMGIDVRHYAQRGQDVVRASCVGCGICSAVCPRGVLRLENSDGDISSRTENQRVIHISEDEVKLLS